MVEEAEDDGDKQKNDILKSAFQYVTHRFKSACTKKTLHKRLPILNWLPKYNGDDALGDIVAGITVGLTVIPQSLAYSYIAGLPPQVINKFIYKYILINIININELFYLVWTVWKLFGLLYLHIFWIM